MKLSKHYSLQIIEKIVCLKRRFYTKSLIIKNPEYQDLYKTFSNFIKKPSIKNIE